MRLVPLPIAGSGGRPVHVNPDQVVCVLDLGDGRSQIVTTGLSMETSMTLIVDLRARDVIERLEGLAPAH